MDEVIARIVAIERQCARDIDQAQAESAGRIEAHRRACEAQKEEERKQILSSESERRIQAITDARQKFQNDTDQYLKDSEKVFADPRLQARIKEEILNILLEA